MSRVLVLLAVSQPRKTDFTNRQIFGDGRDFRCRTEVALWHFGKRDKPLTGLLGSILPTTIRRGKVLLPSVPSMRLALVCLFLIFQVLSDGAGTFKTCNRSRAFGQNRCVRIHLFNTLYGNHSSGDLLSFFQKSHDASPFQIYECALQAAKTGWSTGTGFSLQVKRYHGEGFRPAEHLLLRKSTMRSFLHGPIKGMLVSLAALVTAPPPQGAARTSLPKRPTRSNASLFMRGWRASRSTHALPPFFCRRRLEFKRRYR